MPTMGCAPEWLVDRALAWPPSVAARPARGAAEIVALRAGRYRLVPFGRDRKVPGGTNASGFHAASADGRLLLSVRHFQGRRNTRRSGAATGRWDVHQCGNCARLSTAVANRPAS